MARLRRVIIDSDDDTPVPVVKDKPRLDKQEQLSSTAVPKSPVKCDVNSKSTEPGRRRRKLGGTTHNSFLQPWTQKANPLETSTARNAEARGALKPRVKLRTRRSIMAAGDVFDGESGELSAEEATIVEDVTLDQDSETECASSNDDEAESESDTGDGNFEELDDSSDSDASFESSFRISPPARGPSRRKGTRPTNPSREKGVQSPEKVSIARQPDLGRNTVSRMRDVTFKSPVKTGKQPSNGHRRLETSDEDSAYDSSSGLFFSAEEDLSGPFSRLEIKPLHRPGNKSREPERPKTPPLTPKKATAPRGLVSPSKKIPRIPDTPHHPTSDIFWDQEAVDDWNLSHSLRKLFQPEPVASPSKRSPTKKTNEQKETKKLFEQAKHETATKFLQELDHTITGGKLGELAASTGGVKINWTKQLNTTAGRAKWRRETIRTKPAGGGLETVKHRHHASIELAEKVIDDEQRLLNVVAHEFCHLANFMVTGMTKNPHGKEFKAWAAKCKKAFGDRGINVTTSHSYDIDFKYIWECTDCALEYKRHSKSIHPERQRCGKCKGHLKQIKPAPRAAAGASEYQNFMKEQMKIIKKENPGSPQKDIMKQVAERWAKQGSKQPKKGAKSSVDEIAAGLIDLTI